MKSIISLTQITTPAFLGLIAAVVGFSIFPAQQASAVSAAGFQAGNIISDPVFTDKSSMSTSQIQAFLNTKVPVCDTNGLQNSEMNNSGVPDYNGNGSIQRWEWGKKKKNQTIFKCLRNYTQGGKSAAAIIRDAALEFSINPQVLIVLLQKEQGLVTDTWPLNMQYRSATGYGCPDTAPCDAEYYGFTNQVRWSARMFRSIMNSSPDWYTPYNLGNNSIPWHPNDSCGYSTVNIQNRATQALYNYTPYRPNSAALNAGHGTGNSCSSYGNRNFYLYFLEWFGSTQKTNNLRLILCSSEPYLVERGIAKKRHISDEAMAAWNFPAEYFIDADPGCSYPTYAEDLSRTIRSRSTDKVYFVDLGKTYLVPNQALATSWNLGSLSDAIPQLDGDSINDNLITGKTLGLLVKSDNSSVSKRFIINGGNRYLIAGTSSNETSSLRLVHGYSDSLVQIMSVGALTEVLNPTEHPTPIDYSFQAGGKWYLLDHGKIKEVKNTGLWTGFLSGPTLSTDVLGLFPPADSVKEGFQRHGYYLLNGTADLNKTPDVPVAQKWHVSDEPVITQLLTDKILDDSASTTEVFWLEGNVRLIECTGQKYMVEKGRRFKRQIDSGALAEWHFDDKFFTTGDPGCSYPSYSAQLQQLIRSRKTGKVYYVEDGKAYWVSNQTTATNWSFGNLATNPYPQLNTESIQDTLQTGYTLPEAP